MRVAADTAELKQNFQDATATVTRAAQTIGLAWGAAEIVGGVRQFITATVEAAGHTADLADKTGLSTDSIQRMAAVAQQTGATVDDFAMAAFRLGDKLAGGGDSVERALSKLGIAYSQIRGLSMDQQFTLVAGALGGVANAQQRNNIAIDLFGKSAQSIMPAIVSGYKELADAAATASDTQIRALDDLGDAYDRMVSRIKTGSINVLGSFALAGEGAADVGLVRALAAIIEQGPLAVNALAAVGTAARETGKDIRLPAPPTDPIVDYRAHIDELRASIVALTPVQQQIVTDALAVGESTKAIAEGLKVSELSIKAFVDEGKRMKEVEQATRELEETWNRAWEDMHRTSVRFIDDWTAKFMASQRQMMEAQGQQMLELRRLAAEAQGDLAGLYGGGVDPNSLEGRLAALDQARQTKLSTLSTATGALNDPQSAALIAQTRQAIEDEYQRLFVDIVSGATDTFGTALPTAIASGAPAMQAAAVSAGGSIFNSFNTVFGNVKLGAREMVDSVAGALQSLKTTQAYRDAGIFVQQGPADVLNSQVLDAATRRGQRFPMFAGGVENFAGGMAIVGERGPELVRLPRGANVYPNGTGPGGLTITVNVASGTADSPGAAAARGREVADAVVARLRAQGYRL